MCLQHSVNATMQFQIMKYCLIDKCFTWTNLIFSTLNAISFYELYKKYKYPVFLLIFFGGNERYFFLLC